jgi:glycosyltransferase involved in cell wall biosynthesis
MLLISVVIPTYNGQDRLPLVLEHILKCGQDLLLKHQTATNPFWEVIVVDNNSTDQTAQIVQQYQTKWLDTCQLRYCFEPNLGAAFARQRGIEEAQSELIGLVDDDNLPKPNWITEALIFAAKYPQAGAFGSQIHGKFAKQPDFEMTKLACFIGIIERGEQAFCYQPKQRVLPPTAGLVVRKSAWLNSVPQKLVLNYTQRSVGLASEDLEAILHIQQAGWEIWYNPRMEMEHFIPSYRLDKDYLLSVVRSIGLSRHHIRMMRLKSWQKPIMTLLYLLNDYRKLWQHQIYYYHQIKEDVVLACERELLKSSVFSPFFLTRKLYNKNKKSISWKE